MQIISKYGGRECSVCSKNSYRYTIIWPANLLSSIHRITFFVGLYSWQDMSSQTSYLLCPDSHFRCNLRSWSWMRWDWTRHPDCCNAWQRDRERNKEKRWRSYRQTQGAMEWFFFYICVCVCPCFSVVAQPFPSLLLWALAHHRSHILKESLLQFTVESDRRQTFVA